MDLNFDLDFLYNPEVKGVLIGLLLGALVVAGTYYWCQSIENEQQQRIAFLKSEIQRLRPPSDTPETNWQRIMREVAKEQDIFWGQRLLMLAAHIPEESWLTDVTLVPPPPGNKKRRNSEKLPGFYVTGAFYTTDNELNLGSLGDYLLECLDDKALMQGLNEWRINSITRSSAKTIEFELLNPR